MPPSISEGPHGTSPARPVVFDPTSWLVGLGLVLAAFVAYWLANPDPHYNFYNHFVWQADAFLHGRASFAYPTDGSGDLPANWWFQDVYPLTDADGYLTGQVLLPFPPLPAIVLLPFVALWGLATDQETIAIALGAVGVGLAWWMLGGLPVRMTVRAITTFVFATGTVWWWASAVGSTWYLAHLVAADVALVAVGVALRHDPLAGVEHPSAEAARETQAREARGLGGSAWDRLRGSVLPLDRWQVLVGLLLGVAVTARLPLILGAPFLVLVGSGGSRLRRLVSAGAGGVLPVAALLAYTYLTSGSLFHPGYDYQYRLEVDGYPTLGYHADWGLEDPRYIPQNLRIMLGELPVLAPDLMPNTLGAEATTAACTLPGATRSLFDDRCPLAVPVDVGTSLLVSAPGLLLALFAFRWRGRTRLGLGTLLSVVPIALFNLAHFSQGWVQWGYRFSLDFLPFLLPMVALGAGRMTDGRPRLLAYALLVAGLLVNLWGVVWGQTLGW